MVHSTAEEHQSLPPGGKSKDGDGSLNSEGWVVTRRFRDFETLHVKLKEVLVVIYQSNDDVDKRGSNSESDRFHKAASPSLYHAHQLVKHIN